MYFAAVIVVWTQSMQVQQPLRRGNVEDGAINLSALSFMPCLATFLYIQDCHLAFQYPLQ